MAPKPPPTHPPTHAQAQPSSSTSPLDTASVPYAPSTLQEFSSSDQPYNSIVSFQHIAVQQPYRKYSTEELRLADYQAGRRFTVSLGGAGVASPSSLGSSTFGTTDGTVAVSKSKETTGSDSGSNSSGGVSLFGTNNTPVSLFGNNSVVKTGVTGSVKTNNTTSSIVGSNSTGGGSLFGTNKNPVSLFGNNSVVNTGATSTVKANNTTPSIFGSNGSLPLSTGSFSSTPPKPSTPTPSSTISVPTPFQFSFGTVSSPKMVTTQQIASPTLSGPSTASTKQQPTSQSASVVLPSTNTPNKDRRSTSATRSESKSVSTDQENSNNEESDATSDYESTSVHEDHIPKAHLRLLEHRLDLDELNEISTTPLFTEPVRKYANAIAKTARGQKPFTQYGLLGGDIGSLESEEPANPDPRVFWNIAAPSSFFICGSQGSGKSHTLSCLLENAMAPCEANVLPHPLTGIVFHYDTFISDTGGSPCEVAWLSSNPKIQVRVLCPPTNIRTMRKLYSRFANVMIEELRLNQSDLDTKRMLDLMAVSSGASMPLYLHVVNRVLRDLRIEQQEKGGSFDYAAFKRNMFAQELTDQQLAPLKQRLDTLESFMVEQHAKAYEKGREAKSKKSTRASRGNDWTPRPGMLTIVDLSCPCVTAEMACSLFNICLSLFLEQDCNSIGRVIALDEAHKYMSSDTGSAECRTLTDRLLETIRLQRHLGTRVIISTQEPTISPKLLDLCSVTIVHRFTSPDWLRALSKHLAGVSKGGRMLEKALAMNQNRADDEGIDNVGVNTLALGYDDPAMELFSKIVALRVGEALVFAPSAIMGVQKATPRPPSTSTPATKPDGGIEGLQSQLELFDLGPQSASDKQHQETVTSATATSSGTEKPPSPTSATSHATVKRLAHGVLKVRIRNRTTADGGRSIMAA
ncbi:hypothetical protein B0H65DRAFT_13936 [Neurospora tetraspora]|uniref:P-loop containing nucleoside triphosphate hydrolase protein n=1 Tax=Neurospora tetraspora TaxID=94610 RepID=A0AAE0JNK0_9PEZI|nr:hypothetical protein B0H65DRAFT_13936 [Neurospora tetraspora]